METFTKEARIDAPKERVWAVLADLGSISKRNPGVSRSYSTSESPGGEGATRQCDIQRPGGKSVGYLEERAFDWREGEGLRIDVYETNLPLKSNVVSFSLEENGDGTIVRVSPYYELKYGIAGALMNRLVARRQLSRGMENLLGGLKHYVETGEEVGHEVPTKWTV